MLCFSLVEKICLLSLLCDCNVLPASAGPFYLKGSIFPFPLLVNTVTFFVFERIASRQAVAKIIYEVFPFVSLLFSLRVNEVIPKKSVPDKFAGADVTHRRLASS